MSKRFIERDCTDKCKSIQHGDILSSVITKRSVTDAQLCSYINWKCCTCGQVNDSFGRNSVHLAASCGRAKLLKWLLTKRNGQINGKDVESGYTALHRSIFYGKIHVAVLLIQLGANIHTLDNNDLSPLDHAMKDRLNNHKYTLSLCQAYVWGTNTNYTLGTDHAKQLPDLHDAFHKKYKDVSVQQMCMSKFHSIIVSKDGRVFSCGHGQGGRLGLNTENTVLVPEEIILSADVTAHHQFVCTQACVGLDHSIFLSDGMVWTCGLNTHHVLGIKAAPPQLLQPRMVGHLSNIKGVCAGRFHSVAWSVHAVYTWGLHAGQLGHDKSPNVTYVSPKLVSNFMKDMEFVDVAASDGATVVATKKGDIFVFHEYQIRKVASKQLNVEKVVVVGGHLNGKLSADILDDRVGNELKVIVLQTTGNLYLWQESSPQLCRCIYSLNRPLIVKDVVLSRTQVFFVTVDGEAFRGEFKMMRKKKSVLSPKESGHMKTKFHEFLAKDECQMINVHRYPHVHRAVRIHCDLKGRNFSVIQCSPNFLLVNVPEISTSTFIQDMRNFLDNSDEMDTIHDAIFKVSGHIFPVHRYIIALKSEQLDSLIESNSVKTNPIELTNINPMIFKEILHFIYTGTCDLLICGPCNFNKNDNPIRLLQQAAKRFGIKSLYKYLDNYVYDVLNGYIQLKCKEKKNHLNTRYYFDRHSFKNLYDVVIKSKNGTEISAHKCILVARLEYFNNLFALRWNEISNTNKSTISLPISHNVMETVIDFLYTDEAKHYSTDDIDYISNVLVVSDQLFIERLKEICEVALTALLTLRNAACMLQFANNYNATQLKQSSMEFICLNLAAVLETRTLEILDQHILNDVTDFYSNWNKILCSRVITPYSDAPSDEMVQTIYETYPVNIEELGVSEGEGDEENLDFENKTPKSNMKKKSRTRKSKSTSESNSFDDNTTLINETIDRQQQQIIMINKCMDDDDDKFNEILSVKQKNQNKIEARLHAIKSAAQKIITEKVINEKIPIAPSAPSSSSSNTIYDIPIKMGRKLSQKQMKKLQKINPEIEEQQLKCVAAKNPWQKIEIPSPVLSTTASSPKLENNFTDIIMDEQRQKENWFKMRSRPLIYIQMEDKAMSDLERFYNIDQVSDECITIHKVEKSVFAAPLWVHNN